MAMANDKKPEMPEEPVKLWRLGVDLEADSDFTIQCESEAEAGMMATEAIERRFIIRDRRNDKSHHVAAVYPIEQVRCLRIWKEGE